MSTTNPRIPKIWFCGMSGPNSLENLTELLEPIRDYFDGIVWVLHDSYESKEAAYLDAVKGDGKVIHYYYSGRHDESRNQYLWCGPIKKGQWICSCDDLERLNPWFAANLVPFIENLTAQGINAVYYFGKPLLFQYDESLIYRGTPHEGLKRLGFPMRAVELSHQYPNEVDIRLNVRPLKRTDPYHFVNHYAKYSLSMPWGSNHHLLGLEGNPNANQLFQERETARLKFLDLLDELGVKRDVGSVLAYMKGDMDERFKSHIRIDKYLNNVYRRYVLGEEFKDSHDWNDVCQVK